MHQLYTAAIVISNGGEMRTLIVWGTASSEEEMAGKVRGSIAGDPQIAHYSIENLTVAAPPEWVASFYAEQAEEQMLPPP